MLLRSRQSYDQYLKLPQLLAQQIPVSDPPVHDEMLFIVVHQTYELWFKLLILDLEAIRDAMLEGLAWPARGLFGRVHRIQELLLDQIGVLETMSRGDFAAFRDVLSPASGLQSVQFREMEILSGIKESARPSLPPHLAPEDRARLERRLEEPTVWDGFLALVAAHGLPADAAHLPYSLDLVFTDRSCHGDLCALATDLLTHDELSVAWRQRHVLLAERFIGGQVGTGGTTGIRYLQARADTRYYPLLWQTRR
jgi:tryptophan 2,3-dioxygenase